MKDAGDAQHVGKQLFMYSMPLYVDRAWRERGKENRAQQGGAAGNFWRFKQELAGAAKKCEFQL